MYTTIKRLWCIFMTVVLCLLQLAGRSTDHVLSEEAIGSIDGISYQPITLVGSSHMRAVLTGRVPNMR